MYHFYLQGEIRGGNAGTLEPATMTEQTNRFRSTNETHTRPVRLTITITYNRKVLTETGSRTIGLSFNVPALYQLSYLGRLLFCYLNSGFILLTRMSSGVFAR